MGGRTDIRVMEIHRKVTLPCGKRVTEIEEVSVGGSETTSTFIYPRYIKLENYELNYWGKIVGLKKSTVQQVANEVVSNACSSQ